MAKKGLKPIDTPTAAGRGSQDRLNMPGGTARVVLSVLITAYLGLVLLGPLSNPVASANLTAPLAALISPLHQSLLLGHGYRFFGPDPGPSHRVEYRIVRPDGSESVHVFPDRTVHRPRLIYHRWFMLSETIYDELVNLADAEQHTQAIEDISAEIEDFRVRGEWPSVQQLLRQREQMEIDYRVRTARVKLLLTHVARYLLTQHQGQRIELFLIERRLPLPVEVASGVRLDDPRFLSEPRLIGAFTAVELLEELPQ